MVAIKTCKIEHDSESGIVSFRQYLEYTAEGRQFSSVLDDVTLGILRPDESQLGFLRGKLLWECADGIGHEFLEMPVTFKSRDEALAAFAVEFELSRFIN